MGKKTGFVWMIPVLSGLLLTGCFPHVDYSLGVTLQSAEPLEDPSLCAIVRVTNNLKTGDYTFTTGATDVDDVDNPVPLTDPRADYTVYNGYLGHLKEVHAFGTVQFPALPFGQTLEIRIPFDSAKSPQDLVAPFFDLAFQFSIAQAEHDPIGVIHLGFETSWEGNCRDIQEDVHCAIMGNNLTQNEPGLCGWSYNYSLANPLEGK